MSYAADTSVPVDRSRAEIESTLKRYGATHFGYMTDPHRAVIMFQARGRSVRFSLSLPDRRLFADRTDKRTGLRKPRTMTEIDKAYEQACRTRWRALALVIKAKLEAVVSGITTFENEFLAHVVLPTGGTVGEWLAPQLEASYKSGGMPSMLALASGGDRT